MPSPDRPPPLDDLQTPDREWVAKGLNQLGKLQIADRARKLADNQRVLNTTLAADRANRSLHQRVNDWNFERVKKNLGAESMPTGNGQPAVDKDGIAWPEDEEMKINIDSPTTINYTQPAPAQQPATPTPAPVPAPAPSGFWRGAAIAAGAIGLPLAAAGATYLLTRSNTTNQPPPVTSPDHIGGVTLMPPVGKK